MLNIKVYASGDISVTPMKTKFNTQNLKFTEKGHKREKQYNYKTNVRKCRAAASLMKDKHKRIWLITLTVSNELQHDHKSINKSLNLFTNNLRTNYGLLSYIGTAEYQKNGSIHYHLLCAFDTQTLFFDKINSAWNHAINTIHNSTINATNSVRFGGYNKKTKKRYYYIENVLHAIKYITKYITKNKNEAYTAKCYFISSDIRNVSLTYHTSDYEFYMYLLNNRIGAVYVNEYCTLFTICAEIALDFFDLCDCGKPIDSRYTPCCSMKCWDKKFL